MAAYGALRPSQPDHSFEMLADSSVSPLQDRMQFVEAVLLAGGDEQRLPTISKPLRSLEPRCVRGSIPQGQEVKLEFWYDFSSPWAFLGWTQLQRLQRQFGERLSIEMKPFLLGILFRE